MAVLKKLFHQHGRGMGDEDWYYLARDTESGSVFVYHEWSHRRGDSFESSNAHIELGAYLARIGSAQSNLLALIGTLVNER